MVEVSFYHLLTTPLEKALPRLLEKICALDKRSVILIESEERLKELDHSLWTYAQTAFLPHGSSKDGFSEDQPIWLTTSLENPNDASVVIVTNGSQIENFEKFNRCLDIFSGNDLNATENARERWKFYKNKGFSLTYWQQSKEGSWEKK